MPRGGGSRGGGFRGGGFGGGGFRGGGFRGGPAGFRVGGSRSGGAPFGRTGASRVTSRSPRGPYRHSYYRPHRHYWYGYRPWYYRWWYNPWWSGRWYRPWYYSPVYVGGGISIAIVLGLILLPLLGVAFWFPFSNADTNGYVNYRSTETLYYNEYWYEYENIKEGQEITYSVQSSPSLISFAIWDQPFEALPKTQRFGNDTGQIVLTNNQYEYIGYYLKPGDSIVYNFSASDQIDFFIASGQDLYDWNVGGNPTFFVDKPDVNQSIDVYNVQSEMDHYVVWYYDGLSAVTVNFTINYFAFNVIDLEEAELYVIGANNVPQDTFTVPPGRSGNWYFFVFFDPMLSPDESTEITFDVTYDTGITAVDRWIDVQPILITIIVVVGVIIVAALLARRGQKKLKPKPSSKVTPAKAPVKKATKVTKATSTCIRCNSSIRADASFCPNCGGKVEGRIVGAPTKVTPAKAKSCSFCSSKLSVDDKFCKWCGTEVESKSIKSSKN